MRKSIFYFVTAVLVLSFTSCKTGEKKAQETETRIYILGTIHSNHLISDLEYTLRDLQQVIEAIHPDVICSEMTPDAYNNDMEGYFPPENVVVIEYCKKNNVEYVPVDWRPEFTKEQSNVEISEEANQEIRDAQNNVESKTLQYLMENDWKGYFNFVHNDTAFQNAVKQQHDTKIRLLGDEQDGFWLKRNNIIADNLMKVINEKKPKVVLVTFGLHHKYIIEELLQSKYGMKTKQVNSYTNFINEPVSESVIQRWVKNIDNLKKLLESEDTPQPIKDKINQSRRVGELEKFIASKGVAEQKIRHLFEKR